MGGGPHAEKLLVITPDAAAEGIVERFRTEFPYIEFTLHRANRGEEIPAEIFSNKTILVTDLRLPARVEDAPNLKIIHFSSAGVNSVAKHPIYTDTDITLTTSSGIHGPQIAEWVTLTALVQSHKYNLLYELERENQWGKEGLFGEYRSVRDFVGQRLGVLGYGSIGRQVGRIAKALGMDVIAYTATPKDTPEKRADHGFIIPGTGDPDGSIPSQWFSGTGKASLHHFLEQDIDVLLVSVPLTPDTLHLLGAEEFAILRKRRAFISNIARGDILNQDALVTALHNGDLRGAALDVATPEPLPKDSPLWKAPNTTITPHISGWSEAYVDRVFQVLEVNLKKLAAGEDLINVVNRKRGY